MSVTGILVMIGVMALVGYAIIPLGSLLARDGLPRSLGETLALVHLRLVQLRWGGLGVVLADDDAYELRRLRVNTEGVHLEGDDGWVHVADAPDALGRLAGGWIGLFNAHGERVEQLALDPEVVADGGALDIVRGGGPASEGYQGHIPSLDRDGPLIDVTRVATWLRGANQDGLWERGLQHALESTGSRRNLGAVATAIGFVLLAFLGAGIGVVAWYL